jgi:hypothetical protein
LDQELEVVDKAMRMFFIGLFFTFDADFHELEEITHRALGALESEVVTH